MAVERIKQYFTQDPNIVCPKGRIPLHTTYSKIDNPTSIRDKENPHIIQVEAPDKDDDSSQRPTQFGDHPREKVLTSQKPTKKMAVLGATAAVMGRCVELGCYGNEGCYLER